MKYFNSANPEKFSFFVKRIIELVEVYVLCAKELIVDSATNSSFSSMNAKISRSVSLNRCWFAFTTSCKSTQSS